MQLNKSILEKQIEKANRYLDEQKNVKAEKLLRRMLESDVKNDEAMLLLGIAKRRLGKLKEAIRCFKIVTEIDPTKEEAWGLLTITYIDEGNIEMANETIHKAAKLNPENFRIQYLQYNLVKTYIRHGPFF